MDDIRSGFTNFHPTKEIHGFDSPYNELNEDLSATYKKMKNIIYSYENGSLYRCYLLNGEFEKEEVLYVHFQKRDLSINAGLLELISDDRWLVVPNYFTKWEPLSKKEIKRIAPDQPHFSDFKLRIKLTLYKVYRRIKNA